jgi:hypothetical protein
MNVKRGIHNFWLIQNFNKDIKQWQNSIFFGLCECVIPEASECLKTVGVFGFLNYKTAVEALGKVKLRVVNVIANIEVC